MLEERERMLKAKRRKEGGEEEERRRGRKQRNLEKWSSALARKHFSPILYLPRNTKHILTCQGGNWLL